jgi:PAS domain S-box-containing protein
MTEKIVPAFASAELRRRAEERLGEQPPAAEEELRRLHHELQVHQVELEMQNAELRQTRDALETALQKYTELYEFAPVGYFTLDRKGSIRSVNLTGAALLGVERSRLVDRPFGLFVTDEGHPAFTACLARIFTNPGKGACEVTLRREGEAPLCAQVEGVADLAGEECHLALIDVSERKRAEEALRLEKKAAEALLKMKEANEVLRLTQEAAEVFRREKETVETNTRLKNQFLVNMSHELRTPMTGILGMLQFALAEDLSPQLREYLETTQRSARSLLRILNDILDMAKVEAGKLGIEAKPFSPRTCITEAVDIMTPEVRRKGLAFAIMVAEEVPDRVVGDQMRLRQVLINLIGNAVKFTVSGKVAVQVTAGKMTADGKRPCSFAVTDSGIGIPEDKKDLLFRVFSQVDPSLSRNYGGTGLGLAISKEIVELMGGTISFVSAAGVGSTFSFTLPLQEAGTEHDTHSAATSPAAATITSAPAGGRIPHLLLAEDDPVIRQILAVMLKRANYHLDIAEDGQKAIEMWEKGGYDLVLMDVQMPHLNGFEATRIIREQEQASGKHTPIIAMTAHARQEDEESCLAAGMDAYISKPIDFEKGLQLIAETLKKQPD